MAKIHGSVYLILGIIISAISYYMGQDKEEFKLFIYAGLLMIIIGVIKLAAKSIKNKKQKKQAAQHTHHTPHHTQPKHHARHPQLTYCPRCGTSLNPSDSFCYNCGNRIRHR